MSFFTNQTYEKLFKNPPEPPLYRFGDTAGGKYLIKAVMTGGKNSDVYKALDIVTNIDVVIKYTKGSSFDIETVERQNNAVKELKKWISLPLFSGILPVYDAFYDMRIQKFAIVTPYIKATHPKGLTLADLINNGYDFKTADVNHLFKKVYEIITRIKKATGMLYAHKDIKPENIFICGKSDNFRQCDILLADCGSYSSGTQYLPKEYQYLTDAAKDVFMLIETGKAMCPSFKRGNSKLFRFCKTLDFDCTILDFNELFGEIQDDAFCEEDDILEELIAAYNAYTFSSGRKNAACTERFNRLCALYADHYRDDILPMFLTIKDCQSCDRHDDAMKRMEILASQSDAWDNSYACFFCEYSRDFGAEMLIRLAVSVYNQTDIFSASHEEKIKLCKLFEDIDLKNCFDLSFLGDAAELCEYMMINEGDTALLSCLAKKTEALYSSSGKTTSPQLTRDRKLWRNVFCCMLASDDSVKRRYAQDTVKLTEFEPYNVYYLFYAAKLLMMASCRTAAKPFCFLTMDIIDCIEKHTIQTDKTKILLFFQALTTYWSGDFKVSEYYCNLALKMLLAEDENEKSVPNATSRFLALKSHLKKEMSLLSKEINGSCANAQEQKSHLSEYFKRCYGKEIVRLYHIGDVLRYINMLCVPLSADPMQDSAFLPELIRKLREIDSELPEISFFSAVLFRNCGQFEEAENLIKDYYIKRRFIFPENPFNKDDQRNQDQKKYEKAEKEYLASFIADMLDCNILLAATDNNHKEREENDTETIPDLY